MPIEHKDITDPNIHEPKGISEASVGEIYISDGGGSGSWGKVDSATVDIVDLTTAVLDEIADRGSTLTGVGFLSARLDDISTVSSVIIPVNHDCVISSATLVLGGTLTDANAVINIKNSSGAPMGLAVTVAYSGSSKGNIYSFTATSNNSLVGPTFIEIETDGASTGVVPLYVTVAFTYTINE